MKRTNRFAMMSLGIVLLAVAWSCSCFVFSVTNNKPRCFLRTLPQGYLLMGEYVVSGHGENNVMLTVMDPKHEIKYIIERQREHHFSFEVEEFGEHSVCFQSTDKRNKTVSMDLSVNEKSEVKKPGKKAKTEETVVKGETLDEFANVVKDCRANLDRISHNQKSHMLQEKVHYDILASTEKRIYIWGVFKLLILVVITISQVVVLTNFFKNKSRFLI